MLGCFLSNTLHAALVIFGIALFVNNRGSKRELDVVG